MYNPLLALVDAPPLKGLLCFRVCHVHASIIAQTVPWLVLAVVESGERGRVSEQSGRRHIMSRFIINLHLFFWLVVKKLSDSKLTTGIDGTLKMGLQ